MITVKITCDFCGKEDPKFKNQHSLYRCSFKLGNFISLCFGDKELCEECQQKISNFILNLITIDTQ